MNLLLAVASIRLPGSVRRKKIGELAALTAEAFGSPEPGPFPGSTDGALDAYARLTRDLVGKALAGKGGGGALTEVTRTLELRAFAFGEDLRRRFRIRTPSDARRLIRLAYKAIGISLDIDAAGVIVVKGCFFSRRYSSDTCRVIAAIDQGVISGIAGRGALEFTERITEGRPCCRAVFRLAGGAS